MKGRKCALVTGASRGIGRAVALALAQEQYAVVINYAHNKQAAEAVHNEIINNNGTSCYIQADIRNADDRKRLLTETINHYGRIDVLVNNAGVAPKVRQDILSATEESFDEVLATNLKGPYFLTQLVANSMISTIQSGDAKNSDYQPKIVNVSSVSAFAASTSRGEYCISKAGAAMMTKLYAVRLAQYGIGVYEVRPGVIATDMTAGVKEKYDTMFSEGLTPIARWGRPEDVAAVVRALASGAFAYSTGEVINVDGGFHLQIL
jgi:3-oxoacyl-[acyl-carrier protein] reductase